MILSPRDILPSQDFLIPDTLRFVFRCLTGGDMQNLPSPPLVRETSDGRYVAIDGHNLLAVRSFLGEDAEVVVVRSAVDSVDATRQGDLSTKFDSALEAQKSVSANGISSFSDLVARYRLLFEELAGA